MSEGQVSESSCCPSSSSSETPLLVTGRHHDDNGEETSQNERRSRNDNDYHDDNSANQEEPDKEDEPVNKSGTNSNSRDRFLQKLSQELLSSSAAGDGGRGNTTQLQTYSNKEATTTAAATTRRRPTSIDTNSRGNTASATMSYRDEIDYSHGITATATTGSGDDDDEEEETQDFTSPPESQVSVGSVAPTLTALLLPKHCDLTPVTRNTSYTGELVADDLQEQHGQKHVEDNNNDVYATFTSEDNATGHLTLPGVDDGEDHPPKDRENNTAAAENLTEAKDEISALKPVPFPPSRKFYSFTSRQQYKDALLDDDNNVDDDIEDFGDYEDLLLGVLKPYQPSRAVLDDYGNLPTEELDRIFISRRRQSGNNGSSSSYTNGSFHHEAEDLHKMHRFHSLDRRNSDGSIPSLRHAHTLYSTSNNTQSCGGGGFDDNISISSRGSLDSASCGGSSMRSSARRRCEALEWLQSVEAGSHNVLCEAASSKFLTQQHRHHNHHHHPTVTVPSSLHHSYHHHEQNHHHHNRHYNRRALSVSSAVIQDEMTSS